MNKSHKKEEESIELEIRIRNVGKVTAANTVLVFMIPPKTANPDTAPLKVLRKFDKTEELLPGGYQDFTFSFIEKDFMLANEDGTFVAEEGVWKIVFDNGSGSGYETILSYGV